MKPEYIAQACAAMRKAENLKCNDPEFGEVQVALQVARVKLEMRSGMICPKCLERVAQLIAHRACCGTEHDPSNGKLHGYCVVCGVPWPCKVALPIAPDQGSVATDMRERCAKACEDRRADLPRDDWINACSECAAAIRALPDQKD